MAAESEGKVTQQQSEDDEKKGAAWKRQTSVAESFGTDWHFNRYRKE